MSSSFHGNFDLIVTLNQELLTEIASSKFKFESITMNFNSNEYTGSAEITPSLQYVWLNTEPSKEGSLGRINPSWTDISFVLKLEGIVHIKTITLNGVERDISEAGVIPINAFVYIVSPMRVIKTDAIVDANMPNILAPYIFLAIDFIRHTHIDVRLNEEEILQSPVGILYRLQALLSSGGDPDAKDKAGRELLNIIWSRIYNEVGNMLINIEPDPKLGRRGFVSLLTQPIKGDNIMEDPCEIKDPLGFTDLKTINRESLMLLFDTMWAGGDLSLIQSKIHLSSRPTLTICIPNNTLIGGIIRKAMIDVFVGLKSCDFMEGHTCVLSHPVQVKLEDEDLPSTEWEEFTLESLIAGIDENEKIRILLTLSQSAYGGIFNGRATINIPVSITTKIFIKDGVPKLNLIPEIIQDEVVIVDTNAGVNVVLSILTIGLLDLLTKAINKIFGIVEKMVKEKLTFPTLDPEEFPIEGGKIVAVHKWMNQPYSPTRTLEKGGLIGPHPYRDHDLIINVMSIPIEKPLTVSCITPDGPDELNRIDSVGGKLSKEEIFTVQELEDMTEEEKNSIEAKWEFTIDEAISLIESGHQMVVGTPPNTVGLG